MFLKGTAVHVSSFSFPDFSSPVVCTNIIHIHIFTKHVLTLDVVVECAVLVAVLAQQTESIHICKVLKLNQTVQPVPVGKKEMHLFWLNQRRA